MNLLQRAASMLASKLKSTSVAGRLVRYRRGQMVSEEISGWVSGHGERMTDEQDFRTTYSAWDWSFETSDLVIRGEQIKPRVSDTISETLNGEEIVYEVMGVETGKESDEPDTSKLITTVHTKRVK